MFYKTHSAGGEQNLVHGGLYTWLRLKIYKNQEAVSTQFNEESKQPRRALVMIVMYIAAKTVNTLTRFIESSSNRLGE